MAKPLGQKSILIREAIKNNPDLGNTEIATLINGSEKAKKEKLEVKPGDIAQQKQAMKKAGLGTAASAPAASASKPARNGRRKGSRKRKAPARSQATEQAAVSTPLEAARQVKALCEMYGAETVKGLADLFGK